MKHAYLLMVHNEFEILKRLIDLLDHPNNDIFIHVDKKVRNFNIDEFSNIASFSKVFFTERLFVYWGDYSQIECEMKLLKSAINGGYDYFHLLSGVDLPIKSQDEIQEFFLVNKGGEFIAFDPNQEELVKSQIYSRIGTHRLFTKYSRPTNQFERVLNKLGSLLSKIQIVFKINRIDNLGVEFKKGGNWFSITKECANLIISKEEWIQKTFKNTLCADEIFLPTIVYNSNLRDSISNNDLRSIDWDRGNPYTYTIEDVGKLINSSDLFARKFSTVIDNKAIEEIYNHLKRQFSSLS